MERDHEISFAYGPVAVALPNGGLEVFAIHEDNYLYHIWTTGPGQWNPSWMSLGQQIPFASGPVAVALPNGGLEVFAIGMDNYLYHIWTTGPGQWNPNGWMSLGQQIPFASGPVAVRWASDNIQVFAIHEDNLLYHIWTDTPGQWNQGGWMSLGQQIPFASGPVAVSFPDGNIHLFATGKNNQLYYLWTDPDPYHWGNNGQWAAIGQQIPFASGPVAVRWAGDNLHVFARGKDNYLYHIWTDTPGQWNQSGWMSLGQQIPFASGPVAVRWVGENIQIFAAGADNQLYYLWTDPDPYHWGNNGQWAAVGTRIEFATDPAVATLPDGNLQILAYTLDGQLYNLSTDPDPWNWGSWIPRGQKMIKKRIMSFSFSRFREKIVLNKTLAESIATELASNASGTILLAAKELFLDPTYTLSYNQPEVKFNGRYNLIIVADRFDSKGGQIDLSGSIVTETGSRGIDGKDGGDDEPGQAGGEGGQGPSGTHGMNVKIICINLDNIKVISNGGSGGEGGKGGNGGNGGRSTEPSTRGMGGGNGGNGGKGGNGGNGGQIELIFCNGPTSFPPESLQSIGGNNGLGGQGGAGGAGGEGGRPNGARGREGKRGQPGTEGERGTSINPIVEKINLNNFWERVRSELGLDASNAWANYLVKLGEYYYRLGDNNSTIKLAMGSFELALTLNPNDSEAQTYRNQLLSNQNVLGFDRNLDIAPEFERYEELFTRLFPIAREPFDITLQLISEGRVSAENRDKLADEINKMNRNLEIFNDEVILADKEFQLREKELTHLYDRIKENKDDIRKHEQALRDKEFDLLGNILTVWQVATLIGSMTNPGLKLIAAIPSVPGMFEKVTTKDKDIFNHINWKEGKLSDELGALTKGLEDIDSNNRSLIDKGKVISQIMEGTSDPKIQELLKETAELQFETETGNIRVQQAEISKTIAQKKKDNAKLELQEAEVARNQLADEVKLIGKTARAVTLIARRYLDIVLEFTFKAARSLEIYTYKKETSNLRYDYGRIHPDTEEDAYSSLNLANAQSQLVNLFTEYAKSWAQIADIMIYRKRYEEYKKQGLDRDREFKELEPRLAQEFIKNAKVRFEVHLDEFPVNRFESKLVWMSIGLIGAKSRNPFITGILEHFGDSKSKLRDRTIIHRIEKPRKTLIQATKTEEDFTRTLPDISEPGFFMTSFWGRSPASTWFLSLEEDELINNQIDLSNLSAIRIAIYYETFLG